MDRRGGSVFGIASRTTTFGISSLYTVDSEKGLAGNSAKTRLSPYLGALHLHVSIPTLAEENIYPTTDIECLGIYWLLYRLSHCVEFIGIAQVSGHRVSLANLGISRDRQTPRDISSLATQILCAMQVRWCRSLN